MQLRLAGAAILTVVLAAGAGAQQADQRKEQQKGKQAKGEMVTIEGCLSSGGENGIILTADPGELTSGMSTATSGAVKSVTYQLVVRDPGEFASLMGKRVQVRGRADEEPRARAEAEHKAEASTATGTSGTTAKVETSEKVRMEVRKLTVTSFKPVGGSCPAAR